MSETVTCPGCGAANTADAAQCKDCNFPLADAPPPAAAPVVAKSAEPVAVESIPRPQRPRRAHSAAQPVQMQIWLFVGIAAVLSMFYFAAQGFWKTHFIPVEGATASQQQRADLARRVLDKDSTNVAARIELANTLYDTGNWTEAIVHYRSADRMDPQRATTVVDLGVCYYNLGDFSSAESLFTHALTIDTKQVFAMFNLGIVAESRQDWEAAIKYFHQAMQHNPPEQMRPILEQHVQANMAKTGKMAPPLGKP